MHQLSPKTRYVVARAPRSSKQEIVHSDTKERGPTYVEWKTDTEASYWHGIWVFNTADRRMEIGVQMSWIRRHKMHLSWAHLRRQRHAISLGGRGRETYFPISAKKHFMPYRLAICLFVRPPLVLYFPPHGGNECVSREKYLRRMSPQTGCKQPVWLSKTLYIPLFYACRTMGEFYVFKFCYVPMSPVSSHH